MNIPPQTTSSKPSQTGSAVKAGIIFSLGIVIAYFCSPPSLVTIIGSLIMILLLVITRDKVKTGDSIAIIVLLLAGMAAYSSQREFIRSPSISEYLIGETITLNGKLTRDMTSYDGNTRFYLSCSSIRHGTQESLLTGIVPCIIYNKKLLLSEGTGITANGIFKRYHRPLGRDNPFTLIQHSTYPYRFIVDDSPNSMIIGEKGISVFGRLRDNLARIINRHAFGGHHDLVRAMTIGDCRSLPAEARENFTISGVAHLLAVSGLNVGIIAWTLTLLLTAAPLSKKKRFFIIMAVIFLYGGICGFKPPITRAVIMTFVVLGAFFIGRQHIVENSLFTALLVILAIDPVALFGPSLQLSFSAVWMIITFYPLIMKHKNFRADLPAPIRPVIDIFVISTLAFIATAPVAAFHFGVLSLISIPVNFIAVPLAFIVITIGMGTITLIPLEPLTTPITASGAYITGLSLNGLSWITQKVSHLPYASIQTGAVSYVFLVGFFSWLFVISKSQGRQGLKKAVFYIPLLYILWYTWNPIIQKAQAENDSSVIFFDVGEGDAALVRYGSGYTFLIDTGPQWERFDSGANIIIPALKRLGIHKLDGIFLSHSHRDHIGGFDMVQKSMPVRYIFCSPFTINSLKGDYQNQLVAISAGDSIAFSHGGILVMSPPQDDTILRMNNIAGENNYSLLIRFDLPGRRVLFTSDIDHEVQHLVSGWGNALQADIVKVPHHGAAGLSDDFVKLINPTCAVISCGVRNRFGHPDNDTLAILRNAGSTVWRTDYHGTILVSFPSLEVSLY